MVAQADIEETVEIERSEVQKFYSGANIFVTGGTGFLGGILVQKLIRDCPDVSSICLLIRTKKGRTSDQRIKDMFDDAVFERMKNERPNFSDKIKMIPGDLEEPDLGLNEEDRETIIKETDIVFHVGATVRFDEKIKKAANINVRATSDMLKLAKSMKNLKAFVHCSTAYSFCPNRDIGEVFYDMHLKPQRLLEITQTLNDDELEVLTPKLIGEWPNTYAFTKGIAEKLIQAEVEDLPLTIFRPSMVTPTVHDPVPGWINNIYGPVGVAMGAGAGVLHVARIGKSFKADMVPGDFVVHNMIVAGQYIGEKFAKNRKKDDDEIKSVDGITIFNCTVTGENPITWESFRDYGYKMLNFMTVHALWYYFLLMYENIYLVKFLRLICEKVPAYVVDGTLYAMGKKPKLVKIYEKIDSFTSVIEYFPTHEWSFNNNNTQALWRKLNNTDKKLFKFSMKELDWDSYFEHSFGLGLRLYLFKDPLETLPRALARYQKIKIAHYTLVTLIFCTVFYVMLKILFLFV